MSLPHMTVVQKTKGDGLNPDRYCANHVALVRDPDNGGQVLTFVCSGTMVSIPAHEIDRIEFSHEGRTWCDSCDQRIPGPAADPAPEPSESPEG